MTFSRLQWMEGPSSMNALAPLSSAGAVRHTSHIAAAAVREHPPHESGHMEAYLVRCRVPAYCEPCSETLRVCQLKNHGNLKNAPQVRRARNPREWTAVREHPSEWTAVRERQPHESGGDFFVRSEGAPPTWMWPLLSLAAVR